MTVDPIVDSKVFLIQRHSAGFLKGLEHFVCDPTGMPVYCINYRSHSGRNILGFFAGAFVFLVALVFFLALCGILGEIIFPRIPQAIQPAASFFTVAAVFVLAVVAGVTTSSLLYRYPDLSCVDAFDRDVLFFRLASQGDILGTPVYQVFDPGGRMLGRLQKNLFKSLLRTQMTCLRPPSETFTFDEAPICVILEVPRVRAWLRRTFGVGIVFGYLYVLIAWLRDFLLPTSFEFTTMDGQLLGSFQRGALRLTDDSDHPLDRRIALAVAAILEITWRR